MSFKPSGSLNPHGGPLLKKAVLIDSTAFDEYNVMEPEVSAGDTTDYITTGTAAQELLGTLLAIVDSNGNGVTDNGSGADFAGTYTTGATNESTVNISGIVDISQRSLYSADVDAALGTTTGSDTRFNFLDIIDEDNLDESSASSTSAQYHSWAADPADSGNLIVNLKESWVFGS